MTYEQKIERMKELILSLNENTVLYDKGTPKISDLEWDNQYFELGQLEKELNFHYADSPTQHIFFDKVSELNKVEHNHPMLSLDKTKSLSDIESFIKKDAWIAMLKMDGLTCSLHYENGFLKSAETRGNGIVGEDILHNAQVIDSIPKIIDFDKPLTVDGEIICTYKNFEKFKDDYKNPRNFASGSIRLLDAHECFHRHLQFVAWDIIENNYPFCNYLTNKLMFLSNSFYIVPFLTDNDLKQNSFTLEEGINHLREEADKNSYPIDGIVFKYDKTEVYEAAGKTDHHFKGGLAYKFYDETYETEVTDFEWTMGRTGQLTPVLIYKDIEIDGSVCNRASLHNISVMTKLMGGAYPGQRVWIYKANQIIPQVAFAQTNNPNNTPGFGIPKTCPYCGEPTERRKDIDSEVLYCTNPLCEGKLINRLDHFCGKKGLDMKGISKATLEKLIDWGWINKIEDIFYLQEHREEWINKPGFGVASVDKILNAIEKGRECTLDKYLCSISIPLIGRVASKALADVFITYNDFRKAIDTKDERIYDIPGIGEVMINTLLNFDYNEADKMYYWIIPVAAAPSSNGASLKDKVFVITGKLKTYKNRDELKKVIENNGGKVTGSISSKTSYLINNDTESTSAKNVSAKKLGIPIISEEEFRSMVEI